MSREAMKLALEALENSRSLEPVDVQWVKGKRHAAITALREALAEDVPEVGFGNMAEQPAQQQEPEPDRVKFERHWRKTRGEKKANRELPRHPLQPQTYIQDSANRHWVTWQAAVRSVAPPAQRTWVGLTDEDSQDVIQRAMHSITGGDNTFTLSANKIWVAIVREVEAKLKEKNT